MSRKLKEKMAELKVEMMAAQKGWTVSRPTSTSRYDLVLDDGDRLHRAQVKYAGAEPKASSGVVYFFANNGPDSPAFYSNKEIDVIVVYIPQIDKLVWIGPEFFEGKSAFYIRLEPTKNNQKKGLFWATDHLWQ